MYQRDTSTMVVLFPRVKQCLSVIALDRFPSRSIVENAISLCIIGAMTRERQEEEPLYKS
jgi:hypothetical protein